MTREEPARRKREAYQRGEGKTRWGWTSSYSSTYILATGKLASALHMMTLAQVLMYIYIYTQ